MQIWQRIDDSNGDRWELLNVIWFQTYPAGLPSWDDRSFSRKILSEAEQFIGLELDMNEQENMFNRNHT